MNDFRVLLQAVLDSSGIGKSDIAEVQKVLEKYHLNLTADLNKADLIKTVKQIVPELEKELKKITGVDIKINDSDLIKAVKQIERESLKAANAVEKITSESQRLSKINTVKTWADNNSKAMKTLAPAVNAVLDGFKNPNLSITEFERLNAEFKKININAREMGLLGKTAGDSFVDMKNKFLSWLTVSGTVMLFVQKLKESVTELKNINTILTEISKTNDTLSKSDLMNLGGSSFSVASKYGKKASDYLLGVQEASRAGYSNANGIAELSVLAQSAGDMTAELANKYLIATDAAYQLQGQTDKLNAVLDGQNEITNRNAVNMSDLAEATRVTASQAESSQIKVNEMTAAVGTMIASTQQGGDVAGRAFKAILMNLQQVKGVVDEETGEIIDEDQLTKYEKAAENLGVSLKEVKNGYLALRNPMEILKELSVAYNSLQPDDSRRADLIGAIGGKQRGNQLDALLKNWAQYEKMLNDYSEGSGSAFKESMKSANNWEGSLNELSNTITEIVNNFVEADTVIGGLNLFNGLLQGINGVTNALGSLGAISAIGGGILGSKGLGQRKCCRYNRLRGSRKSLLLWLKAVGKIGTSLSELT